MIANQERETLIAVLLQQLDAAHPRTLKAADLHFPLRFSGLSGVTLPEVESVMADLVSLNWVEPESSAAAAEITRYKRTEAARVWLRKQGL